MHWPHNVSHTLCCNLNPALVGEPRNIEFIERWPAGMQTPLIIPIWVSTILWEIILPHTLIPSLRNASTSSWALSERFSEIPSGWTVSMLSSTTFMGWGEISCCALCPAAADSLLSVVLWEYLPKDPEASWTMPCHAHDGAIIISWHWRHSIGFSTRGMRHGIGGYAYAIHRTQTHKPLARMPSRECWQMAILVGCKQADQCSLPNPENLLHQLWMEHPLYVQDLVSRQEIRLPIHWSC